MTLIPELERELQAAIARRRRARAPRGLRGRLRLAAIPAALLLVLTTAALAATGVIPIGSPVHDPSGRPRPDAGLGIVAPGSAALLDVETPDPVAPDGPPWGLRISSTTRGLGCLQAARRVGDRLGVLGTAGSFQNDGKLHPLSVGTLLSPSGCGELDANGRLYYNVVASDARASASVAGGCEPARFTRGVPADRLCDDARDLRNLYFGTLGPEAQSVTYTAENGARTVPVAAPEGAYLIVLPIGGDRDFNGTMGGLYPSNGPITKITFRDGRTCDLGRAGPVGGVAACPIPGYEPVAPPDLSGTRLASPIDARARRDDHGSWTIVVRFRAPVAVTDARSAYNISLSPPRPARQYAVGSTGRNIRRGETVTQRFFAKRRGGLYRGRVTFVTSSRPGMQPFQPGGRLVGTFKVRVP